MPNNRTQDAARLWQARLDNFFASGLTAKEFIAREELSPPAFFRWKKALAAQKDERSLVRPRGKSAASVTPQFIEICAPTERAVHNSTPMKAEIVTASGVRLIVPLSFVENYIASLLQSAAGGTR